MIGSARRPVAGLPALVFAQEVGRVAVEHLAARGHRRVLAFMPAPAMPGVGALGEERLAGAVSAAAERGVALDVQHADADVESAAARLVGTLAGPDGPTAVFAFNDEHALAAMAAFADAGVDVPGRVAVVGCDDSPAARLTRPRLTTVRLIDDALWIDLATVLHAMIEGDAGESVVARPVVVAEHDSSCRRAAAA